MKPSGCSDGVYTSAASFQSFRQTVPGGGLFRETLPSHLAISSILSFGVQYCMILDAYSFARRDNGAQPGPSSSPDSVTTHQGIIAMTILGYGRVIAVILKHKPV